MYVYAYVVYNMYIHTYYVLIEPPIPYIASSPLWLLRVFASYIYIYIYIYVICKAYIWKAYIYIKHLKIYFINP